MEGRLVTSLAAQALDLARRVKALEPHRVEPERFHEDKSEIENDLKKLARKIEEQRV